MATPLELANGKPITWVGATDAPGRPGDPIQISISPAAFNYSMDANVAPTFSHVLSPQQFNLMVAAAHVWELEANVHFNFLPDVAPGSGTQHASDIRVGLSELNKGLGQPSMEFVGRTQIHWDANNKFTEDNVIGIEDPAEHPVTQLKDGDFLYDNTQTTMFQSMIHELGHAIGLDHSPNDPNSIMNPVSSSKNPLPDAQDIAAAQSLYGAPTQPLQLSQGELATLQNLFSSIA